MTGPVRVTRTSLRLLPDPRRVITQPFVPGEELLAEGESRVEVVMERILALPEDIVCETLRATLASFEGRHPKLEEALEASFELVAHRLPKRIELSAERRQLLGAYFTHEYSVEAAALFNPSIVPAPSDDPGRPERQPFVLSLRGVGEGHRSSIVFRTGSVDGRGRVRVDTPSPFVRTGTRELVRYDKQLFVAKLAESGFDNEVTASVFGEMGDRFYLPELEMAVGSLHPLHLRRPIAHETIRGIYAIAAANYQVNFPGSSDISERVLVPMSADEQQGLEDARFVLFTEEDGSSRYYGTYTAFDGTQVRPQLIETADFTTFRMSTLNGRFAQNKGMALFPRRVGGRYVSLSRWDRENTTIAMSDNLYQWDEAALLQSPEQPWELIQIGNCGSPIETPEGWLVFTHGVGPMRVYSIGALLLDLEDPRHVRGQLRDPLMVPDETEREGYVPNVLYSCGAMLHGDRVIFPYGFADHGVRVATIPLSGLLAALLNG